MRIEDVLWPERDLMLVRREPGETAAYGGLILPDSVTEGEFVVAEVLRGGASAPYAEGQRVVTARRAGTGLAIQEDQEIAIISPLDVLALLPSGDEVAA